MFRIIELAHQAEQRTFSWPERQPTVSGPGTAATAVAGVASGC
jgi:hypothetical protein